MSTSKVFNFLAILAAILLVGIVGVLFYVVSVTGVPRGNTIGYEDRLFDDSYVHSIDIICDDWEGFLSTATNEEYVKISIVIDDKAVREVGMRAKGNATLAQVGSNGSEKYSLKINFDEYKDDQTYFGLEDMTLSNMIQDSTCMMDYVCYHMFNEFGVDAPLSSFAWVRVNGEDFGLYTCVEGIGKSFIQRTHILEDYALYKPNEQGADASVIESEDWSMEEYVAALEELRGGEGTVDREALLGTGTEEEAQNNNPFGGGGGGFMTDGVDGGDARLQYMGDDPANYSHLLGNTRSNTVDEKAVARLVEALRHLGTGEDLENYVDVEEVIRFMVVQQYVQNDDSYLGSIIHNFYLYEGSGKLYMTPWDYNLAFGGMSNGSSATDIVNAPIDSPTGKDFSDDESGSNQGGGMFGGGSQTESYSNRPMVSFIFQNETYTQRYHELYYEFITTVDIQGIIDNAYNLIHDYVAKDPSSWYTVEEFEKGVETLKKVNELRVESVYGQLAGTIPSTASGQKENKSALVDASSIQISDMGSQMNMGSGPGHNMRENEQQNQDGPFGGGGFMFGF